MAKITLYVLGLLSLIVIMMALFTFDQQNNDLVIENVPQKSSSIKEEPSQAEKLNLDEVILDEVIIEETSSNDGIDIVTNSPAIASKSYNIQKNPYKELITRNSDYIGWIQLEDTNVNYPIVKSQDNDYYLKRNFDQAYDEKGTIYMDYRNFGLGFDQHTIIYGHNMKDGSMFGDLKLFKDESYALSNRYIQIEDLYKTRTYLVIASYYDIADSSIIQTYFSDDTYEKYLEVILDKSQIDYGYELNTSDQLLTLVTCTYEVDDGRYFIHAVDITDK